MIRAASPIHVRTINSTAMHYGCRTLEVDGDTWSGAAEQLRLRLFLNDDAPPAETCIGFVARCPMERRDRPSSDVTHTAAGRMTRVEGEALAEYPLPVGRR